MDVPWSVSLPGEQGGLEQPLPKRAFVKNTFLEFLEDEDPWLITSTAVRQMTDSIVDCSSTSLRQELSRFEESDGTPSIEVASAPGLFAGSRHHQGSQNRGIRYPHAVDTMAPNMVNLKRHDRMDSKSQSWGSMARRPNSILDTSAEETLEDEPEPSPELTHSSVLHEDEQDFTDDATGASSAEKKDSEINQRIREIAENGGGLSGCTTVMLRHIPAKYTQRQLIREINNAGFLGKYDFFYLPMDPRSRANRGFAFVNFESPELAQNFYTMFHGRQLQHFKGSEAVVVLPADLQGFECNAAHYTASRVLRRRQTPHSRPLFFRPLPSYLKYDAEEGAAGMRAVEVVHSKAWESSFPMYRAMEEQMGFAEQWQLPARHALATQRMPWDCGAEMAVPHAVPVAMAQPQLPARFCAFCGKSKQADYAFCPYCGKRAIV